MPETIETERMVLRPPRFSDAQAMHHYASKAHVVQFLSFPRNDSIERSLEYIEHTRKERAQGRSFAYAPFLKATGALMGCYELRFSSPRVEMGYALDDLYWSQGYASEAAAALMAACFAQQDIHCVFATCSPENAASRRVMEKIGMAFRAELPGWSARPNMGVAAGPVLLFSALKAEPSS